MTGNGGKVHVVRVSKTGYVDKQGRRKDYSSAYLRRTYRDGGKVKNETVANLSALPDHVIDLIDAGLKGQQLVPAAGAVTITGSLPHGHAAAVHAMAAKLGLPALLGPAGRQRDLALALIISRVVAPGSKLSTLTWWADTTLGADLGVADASTDDIYAAMDWLEHRQDAIEAGLARRHLAPAAQPVADGAVRPVVLVAGRLALPAGRPRLLPGRQERETADRVRAAHRPGRPPGRGPGVPRQHRRPRRVHRHRGRGPEEVRAGPDGHGRRPRHDHQRPDPGPEPAGRRDPRPDPYGWITALRAPAIRKLMADDGPLQLQPLRPAGPRRDHLTRLPRRAADRLPQPGPGRRPRPHPRGPARRHREAARPPHSPASRPASSPAPGRSGSRSAR